MTSSTKPEVHNVSQRRRVRTESRPQPTCKNVLKFGRVVSEICEQADTQTDTVVTKLRTPLGGEVANVMQAIIYLVGYKSLQ